KFQLAYIDSYTQHEDIIHQFQDEFNKYNQFKSELALLLEKEKQSKADEDYYRFQFEELNTANLNEDNEQEELENELSLLTHAEEIKSNLANVLAVLNSGEQNMTSGLKELSITLSKIAALHPAMDDLSKRLESCCIELKDIAQEIDFAEQKIVFNSLRLEEVNERLNIIYHLQKKHRVQTINELRKIKEDISIKLGFINNLDNQINDLQKSCITSENKLKEISTILTKNRKKAIAKIEKGVLDVLKNLAIPNAEFQIAHSLLDEYNNWGNDKVVFLFNANKGGALNEIAKVASGGELARLMLSIKSLISEKKLLPTIIFDEIDQGVSGEIADKVGNIMKKMSETMQVITITHLPQIASKGNAHLMVYKEINQNTTFTRIKNLNQEERVEEIAKMLSGNELSKAAVENAKVLLKNKN
ncbi:MAG TPA: DNA repair protein RecN, partial [Bacteroidales bacterium]|nr:DNA repair protein RecN [Bacteroidales bacterium]